MGNVLSTGLTREHIYLNVDFMRDDLYVIPSGGGGGGGGGGGFGCFLITLLLLLDPTTN